MSRRVAMMRVIPLVLLAAMGCGDPTAPGAQPDKPMPVAGATYALVAIDGHPVPYLSRDQVAGDLRIRTWIAASTIRFDLDGGLQKSTHWRQLESTVTDDAGDDWSWVSYRGGYFRQQASRVAVAWGYITVPTDTQYTDTLRVQRDTLVRLANLPPNCLLCPVGRQVEWTYARR